MPGREFEIANKYKQDVRAVGFRLSVNYDSQRT